MSERTITEQIVREAPQIEAYKEGLLQSAKGLSDRPVGLPAYQVAGFNPDQLQSFDLGRQGIGAYQPYLYGGNQALQQGLGTTQEAADVLRGADTRNQYQAAQQAMNLSGQAANQMSGAAGMINPAYQGLTAASQYAMGSDTSGMFPGAYNFLNQGAGLSNLATIQAAQAAQLGQAPTTQAALMGGQQQVGAQQVGAGNIQAAQTGFNPNLQAFQMGPAQQVSTSSLTAPGSAEAYMSPYLQNALQPTLQEMQRQAEIQATRSNAQAVGAGAFGGSRQAIERAEANRNLMRSQSDVIAQGMQGAFSSAQQQFNAEQQARLAAQQANQAAGLTVGQQNLASQQQTQQLGTQTGLQTSLANLSSQQQANVQNEANRLQASGMNQQAALQAALANQQVGYNTAAQNAQMQQQANLANQQTQAQFGLTGAQLGMQAAGVTGQMGGQMGQFGAQTGQLAGQQAGIQQNIANLLQQQASTQGQLAGQQANIYGQQAGAYGSTGQGIGALAGQQFGIGQQMAQGLGQFGAQLGNLGVQRAALGQSAQQLGQQDVGFLYNIGQQQQGFNQQQLDAQRNTALQQAYEPYQRLSFLSDIYKGAPSSQQSISAATAPTPSVFQQAAGLGISGLATAAGVKKAGLF